MGADFVFAVANVSQPKTYWFGVLGGLSDDQISAYIESSETGMWWSEMFDQETGYEFRTSVLERIGQAVDATYSNTGRQSGTFIDNHEEKWAVTGGMSWGDDPTDSYQDIEIMCSFQEWWEAEGYLL